MPSPTSNGLKKTALVNTAESEGQIPGANKESELEGLPIFKLFITSLVTLGRAAVNCYDRSQPPHYTLHSLGVFNSMFWPL